MKRYLKVFSYAQRLFWFLELMVSPQQAAEALLSQPRVQRWLEKQPAEDQEKIRAAAPLVVQAILTSIQ
ncbi:MAG: hypothetical protein ACE149_16635 [Armatimonadota bacterium]